MPHLRKFLKDDSDLPTFGGGGGASSIGRERGKNFIYRLPDVKLQGTTKDDSTTCLKLHREDGGPLTRNQVSRSWNLLSILANAPKKNKGK